MSIRRGVNRRQLLRGAAVLGPAAAVAMIAQPVLAQAPVLADQEDRNGRATRVVHRYFGILNAGMASADADFSALATVYDKDAVLTQSSPAGVTTRFAGLDAIIGFYVAAWQALHGVQWTQDSIRQLASSVVLSYEHAGRVNQTAPGKCSHLFDVRGHAIQTLDWVTFYPGIP